MPTTDRRDALTMLLINEWQLTREASEAYWQLRKSIGPGDDSAILAALEDAAQDTSGPFGDFADTFREKLADARHAVTVTAASEHFISAPSTNPLTEGRHGAHQFELRRKAFLVGRDRAQAQDDGAVVIRYAGDTFTTYLPVTAAEFEAFLDRNRQKMEAVAALGESVRAALSEAAASIPQARRTHSGYKSGVDVHVGGSQVSVFWWTATWDEEQRQRRASTDPWIDRGGYRDQVAALLEKAGIATRPDGTSLDVICP